MKRLLLIISFIIFPLSFSLAQPSAVILTAGQSNADGRVPVAELPDYIHYDNCLCSYGSGDFKKASGEFAIFSPTVARTALGDRWGFDAVVYYQLEQLWQQPFYVIKQTMGGTAIDTLCQHSTHGMYWCADPQFLKSDKSLLKAFIRQIDDCLPHLPQDFDVKCLLWHQGESDKPQASRYYDNLKAVIAYIRQYLAQKTGKEKYLQLPVVSGTFAKDSRQGSPVVADALYRMAREDEHFYVVDASDLSLQSDQIHFDAKGSEKLGQRFFDLMKKEKIVR